jgi:L-fucose isomerase-like protein
MKAVNVVLLGLARQGFDTDLAARLHGESLEALARINVEVVHPGKLLSEPAEAEESVKELTGPQTDALIVQLATFVDGRFIAQIAAAADLPILLWSFPEPEASGRLRLNSLTGLNSAAYVLGRLGRKFKYVYGPPGEESVARIESWLKAALAARRLKAARIGVVGGHPPGFFASGADPLALTRILGTRLVPLDLETLFAEAEAVPEARTRELLEQDRRVVAGLDDLDSGQLTRSTRFTAALGDRIKSLGIDAVAVKCWPEFFNSYRAVACSTLGHLNDAGIPAACETDILGAVSMLAEHYLTGKVTFLGDMVHVAEERNSAVFWHCGAGAVSLASPKTGAAAGVQPNRDLAYAFNHRLRAGEVTLMRLGQTGKGYRMFIARGEALDDREHYWGTSVEVRFQRPVGELLDTIITEGFEFHFSIVWEDIRAELEELCALLGIPATIF